MARGSTVAVGILAAAVAITACTRRAPEAGPTTTAAPITIASTTSTAATTTTVTTLPPIRIGSFPDYRIIYRGDVEGPGDAVVVLLDPSSYEQLTDLDLYNVIVEVVEEFPPIYEAHLIDDEAALEAVIGDEPTTDQEAFLAAHYLARLEEGFRVVYVGPFAASGSSILGS